MFSFENIRSYIKTQTEISRNAVKLVKYKDRNVLSITTVRYKRIMFTHIKGAETGMTALMKAVGMSGGSPVGALKKKLEDMGLEVFVYESS